MGGRAVSAPSSSIQRRCGVRVRVATSEAASSSSSDVRMVTIEENAGRVYPTNLRCALQVIVPTPEAAADADAGRSLSDYMRLPVDQYVGIELPMGAEMKRVAGEDSLFQLEIPGLKFLSLEVKPVVRVRVRLIGDGEKVMTWTGQSGFPGGKSPEWREAEATAVYLAELKVKKAISEARTVADTNAANSGLLKETPMGRAERDDVAMYGPCVLIEAISCRVEGKAVEDLKLNDFFTFRGTTCFRWSSKGDKSITGPGLRRLGPGGDDESNSGHAKVTPIGECKAGESNITGWTDIGVAVDPPGPFALLPNSFAEGVGDAVMKATLKSLQTVFLKGLGTDYAKWASDAEYRKARELAAIAASAAANAEAGAIAREGASV